MSIPIETIIDHEPELDDETLAESGFYWRERDGVKILICEPLEKAGFVNGFSTRLGGVSPFPANDLNLAGFGEDSAENIAENRRRFLDVFGGRYTLTTVWQMHGDCVKAVRSQADAENTEEKFDALVSDLPRILAGVKTADCVPVLIGDPKTNAFAAIHAGWRGSVQSIAAKAVARMSDVYQTDPVGLICAIGPAASGNNYEVGQEVIDAFDPRFSTSGKYFTETRPGHALIDLHHVNRDQLIAVGVRAENIFISPFCTMERTDLFFSYRIEKPLYGKTGRLLSMIGRQKPDR